MMSCDRSAHKPLLIIGYTTKEHLCLDLDGTSPYRARALAKLIIDNWPTVGDCLIMQSSHGTGKMVLKGNGEGITRETVDRDNYHLIFDNLIGYDQSCRIIECIAACDIINSEYIRIRYMRNDMTLRVSSSILTSNEKPAPVPVDYVSNDHSEKGDGKIGEYLDFYTQTLKAWVRFQLPQPSLSPQAAAQSSGT